MVERFSANLSENCSDADSQNPESLLVKLSTIQKTGALSERRVLGNYAVQHMKYLMCTFNIGA